MFLGHQDSVLYIGGLVEGFLPVRKMDNETKFDTLMDLEPQEMEQDLATSWRKSTPQDKASGYDSLLEVVERLAGKFDERNEKLDRKMQQLHGQMNLAIPKSKKAEPKLVPSPRATDRAGKERLGDGLEHTGNFFKKMWDQTTTVDREKVLIRPPSSDGTSSWEYYLAQLEVIAELNSWNDCTKTSYLASSLRGPAQAVLGD